MAADRFYGALGTTPRGGGFNVQEVLVAAAAVMLAFAPIAWAAVALTPAAVRALPRSERWRPSTLEVLVCAAIPFVLLLRLLDEALDPVMFAALMPAIGFALVGTTVAGAPTASRRFNSMAFASAHLPTVVALGSLAVWVGLWASAPGDAHSMRPGREPTLTTAFLA